jgi:hypothetical protein
LRYVKEAATFSAFDLATAKLFLRVDYAADDALITSLVSAATKLCENYLNWHILDYTYTAIFNGIPAEKLTGVGRSVYFLEPTKLELKKIHVQSIVEVKSVDVTGVESIFPNTNYHLLATDNSYFIELEEASSWPSPLRSWDSFHVRFKCGYNSVSEIDESIISAIKIILFDFYENRNSLTSIELVIPPKALAILSPIRIYR